MLRKTVGLPLVLLGMLKVGAAQLVGVHPPEAAEVPPRPQRAGTARQSWPGPSQCPDHQPASPVGLWTCVPGWDRAFLPGPHPALT